MPYADRIRSYSKPGEALILFQVRDSSPPKEMPQIWYTVRKKLGDLLRRGPGPEDTDRHRPEGERRILVLAELEIGRRAED